MTIMDRQQAPRRRIGGDNSAVCVFCGSGSGNRPEFANAARQVGALLAEHGVGLVYGGGDIGLMGEVARSTLTHGGHVTGIIPEFLKKREHMLDAAQETIIVPDMHTRKRMMYERANAFIALPGGIGTLEELVEQMTWAQLGQHNRPILLLNVLGFWNPLLDLLQHMREASFIRPGLDTSYIVAGEPEEAVRALIAAIDAGARAGLETGDDRPVVPGPF